MASMIPWIHVHHPYNPMLDLAQEFTSSGGDLAHAVRVAVSWCLAEWRGTLQHPKYGPPLALTLMVKIRNDHIHGADGMWTVMASRPEVDSRAWTISDPKMTSAPNRWLGGCAAIITEGHEGQP